MAARPAKRRRRSNTTILGEDENQEQLPLRASKRTNVQLEFSQGSTPTLTLSPQRANGTIFQIQKSIVKASPKSSPEKERKNGQTVIGSEKSKTLHTFFTKAAEEQRWHRKSESKSPETGFEDGEFGDVIEDDDLPDDILVGPAEVSKGKKSFFSSSSQDLTLAGRGSVLDQQIAPALSQRFVKPSIPAKSTSKITEDVRPEDSENSHSPWADRYGPNNLEELAVHKKKVADVRLWINNVLNGHTRQRLLVLRGPAGSGKSTTVSLMAQADRFDLVAWRNPTVSDAGTNISVAQQFEDFLSRGGNFGSLDFSNGSSQIKSNKTESSRRIIMVEDFPSTLTRSSNALESFRSILSQFLTRSTTSLSTVFRNKPNPADVDPPMIMIISETLLSSSTALTDSFTAHRLLGPEILTHPQVAVMDFNPVAPTFINKALDQVIKKEARDSRRRRTPGPAVLQTLAEMGDVRSAINSLEFLCVRGDNMGDWSGTVATKSRKSSKEGVPLTEMERNSLKLISQRETTLDMFHAAGKIVYNKREDPRVKDTRAEPPPKPPDHLMHLYKPKVSQVDIEALLSETGTDIQTFISTIHENYILSCNGDDFAESFEGCAEILSASDVLNPDSRRARGSKSGAAAITQANLQNGSSDTLRQDEISFQVATRGLLFSLPYPVNRTAPSSGKKSDAYKMFYPGSLRLWKPTEEIDALISLFVQERYHGGSISAMKRSMKSDGVASWKPRTVSNIFTNAQSSEYNTNRPLEGEEEEDLTSLFSTPIRENLILEILPYLTTINNARKAEDTTILKRITQFHGMQIPNEDSTSFDEDLNEDEIAIKSSLSPQKPSSRIHGVSGAWGILAKSTDRTSSINNKVFNPGDKTDTVTTTMDMERLYISDDDIEDD